MLLHRISDNLRQQNWTTVAIELVVVFVGIYLGLQADAWNEERKDRELERANLEQLYLDIESNGDQAAAMGEFHADKVADLEFAIDVIVRGVVADDEKRRFSFAIISMYQLPPLGANMGSYKAMIGSGDLGLVQDQELKSELVDLDAAIESQNSLLDYFRLNVQRDAGNVEQLYEVVPNAERTDTVFNFDYAAALADPRLLTRVSGQLRSHRVFREMRDGIAEKFKNIQLHIGEILGMHPENDAGPGESHSPSSSPSETS